MNKGQMGEIEKTKQDGRFKLSNTDKQIKCNTPIKRQRLSDWTKIKTQLWAV